MCLIVFAYGQHEHFPWIVAANRDEFYQRPTAPIERWQDHPDIVGGRDLLAGGSWMAVTAHPKFAAVTNYREPDPPEAPRSRGDLVRDFLLFGGSAAEFVDSLGDLQAFGGFNLLLADADGLFYVSNRSEAPLRQLQPGIYSLSNHLLDTPWPKVERARTAMHDYIARGATTNAEELLWSCLRDESKAPDEELPSTGISLEFERLLSSPFIQSATYGTRSSTVLVRDRLEGIRMEERTRDGSTRTRTVSFRDAPAGDSGVST